MNGFKQILKNRSLTILGISESVSNIGNWITMMAVFSLVVFRSEGGIAESSGVFLAGLVPTLLFSPAAGWLLDRFDRRNLMILSELTSGLVVAGLIFVDQLEWIYLLLGLQAVSIAIMTPARQAVVPDLVERVDLSKANAFLQQLAGIIKIGAPMLAGLLLAVVNPHTAIILDVVSFGLSAVILTRLPALPPRSISEGSEARTQSGEKAPAEGPLQVLKGSSRLRLLFSLIFLGITVIVGFDVLSPVYIRDVLASSEDFFGLLVGLIGVGTLVATLLVMSRKEEADPWRDVLVGTLLLACIPAGLAAGAWLGDPQAARIIAIGVSLLGGIGNGLLVVQTATLLQLLSPPALLGRLSGYYQSTAVAGQLVGILITPLLIPGLLSLPAYLIISAVALTGITLLALFSLQRTSSVAQTVEGTD